MAPRKPTCTIIAGPNGAGKTTFAYTFLTAHGITRFLNVDYIAKGLSPLNPALVTIRAAKIFLQELNAQIQKRESFAFETTLSGLNYLETIEKLHAAGFNVHLVFLRLESEELALQRVKTRVIQGGHHVAEADILRRYRRGLENFEKHYRDAVDDWAVYDNSFEGPVLVAEKA